MSGLITFSQDVKPSQPLFRSFIPSLSERRRSNSYRLCLPSRPPEHHHHHQPHVSPSSVCFLSLARSTAKFYELTLVTATSLCAESRQELLSVGCAINAMGNAQFATAMSAPQLLFESAMNALSVTTRASALFAVVRYVRYGVSDASRPLR